MCLIRWIILNASCPPSRPPKLHAKVEALATAGAPCAMRPLLYVIPTTLKMEQESTADPFTAIVFILLLLFVGKKHGKRGSQSNRAFHRTLIHTPVAVPAEFRMADDRLFPLRFSMTFCVEKNIQRTELNACPTAGTFLEIYFWRHFLLQSKLSTMFEFFPVKFRFAIDLSDGGQFSV